MQSFSKVTKSKSIKGEALIKCLIVQEAEFAKKKKANFDEIHWFIVLGIFWDDLIGIGVKDPTVCGTCLFLKRSNPVYSLKLSKIRDWRQT